MVGSFLASATHALRNALVRAFLRLLRLVYPPVTALFSRVHCSPGVPVSNPCPAYWMLPQSPLAQRNADPSIGLPEYADIVIIGSGITGTSIARTILDHNAGKDLRGTPLRIVMLEARDACSGATGRNGGHITPILYLDYAGLKQKYGKDIAKKVIRFRHSHISQVLAVAKEENLLDDCQGRQVEAFDAFHDPGLYRKAKALLQEYQNDLPEESASYKIYDTPEQLQSLQLSSTIIGCLSTRAGAVHPYRLVTGILTRLLHSYQSNFDLYTHTPCTGIKSSDELDHRYTIQTPRGEIRASHVIHATNGWASHLLPGMRGKIFPARGVMTAQIPRRGLGDGLLMSSTPVPSDETQSRPPAPWIGTRSYVFYPSTTVGVYDYLTQQLPSSGSSSSYPQPRGELMLGGGFSHAVVSDLGNADDSEWNTKVSDYLANALGDYFSAKSNGKKEEKDKVEATWSGVLGISADERPWVGRIPEKISGRHPAAGKFAEESSPVRSIAPGGLAPSGEWIAAGYSGEGMVHAWLSGKALACMVLGLDDSAHASLEKEDSVSLKAAEVDVNGDLGKWFPDGFRITEERWEKANAEDLMASYLVH